MDDKIKGALPLAFVLALAAELPATGASIPQGEGFWRAGSLSQLLGEAGNSAANTRSERTAQWFNFRNCFTGNWRNC